MYSLKDDKSIIIKGADKGAAVIVWDREDYIKEAKDKEVYMEVPNDSSALVSTICKSLEKIKKRGDLSEDKLNYFLVKDPKFARFYVLHKIHKRLYDVPGRPVISSCGFYTENHRKYFFIFRLPLTAPCTEGKVVCKRHKSLLEKNQRIRSTSRRDNSPHY